MIVLRSAASVGEGADLPVADRPPRSKPSPAFGLKKCKVKKITVFGIFKKLKFLRSENFSNIKNSREKIFRRPAMEKIQKNIPMPEPEGAGRPTKYPWDTMEVGDSFPLPTLDQNTAISYCSGASRRYKKKFTTRLYKGEYRVWRIR